MRGKSYGALATALFVSSTVFAQSAEPPKYLGVLAGSGSPQQPAGVRMYGTDLGWTFSHQGKLLMLFGDSWRTEHSLCDVQTQGIDHNDDFQASLPAKYPGGVPSLSIVTQPNDAREFEPIQLIRAGQSLNMGPNRTPLAGFSDGEQALGFLHSGSFLKCDAATAGCPAPLTCAPQIGQCQPPLLELAQLCDTQTNQGCYEGQLCMPEGRGVCVDPGSPQQQQLNRAALEVELAVQDPTSPTHYLSKHTWATNKFYNLAVRTVEGMALDGSSSDYKPGNKLLLLWGRPGYFASEGLNIPLYFMVHKLPIAKLPSGQLDFRPSFFAGLDASGKPTWSDQEAQAAPLSLDGKAGGSTTEAVAAANQHTVSWLPAPINKWVMLYGGGGTLEGTAGPPGFVALRFADKPWGPWTPHQVHFADGAPNQPNTPLGPGGLVYHPDCVDSSAGQCARTDPTRPLHIYNLLCQPPKKETDSGYFYAPNIIEEYTTPSAAGGLDIYWNLSSWNPYRVHLFRTTIAAR